MRQRRIDDNVQDFYGEFRPERERLVGESAAGRLELTRVQELLRARLEPGSRVLDIGGATGVHATWLAADGHQVILVDPVVGQVYRAATVGTFEARVGDARRLEFEADAFDVALLFGPLYHLAEARDRQRALAEAVRVVRAGGWVFAAGISRFSLLAAGTLVAGARMTSRELVDVVEHGRWVNRGRGFPGGHFHTSAELSDELRAAGLAAVEVVGIEGPVGVALELAREVGDDVRDAALVAARALEAHEPVRDTSPHLMGWGVVPESSA